MSWRHGDPLRSLREAALLACSREVSRVRSSLRWDERRSHLPLLEESVESEGSFRLIGQSDWLDAVGRAVV